MAQATAPGQGAVAVVRLSGGDALEILRRISVEGAPRPEPRVAGLREIVDPDEGTVLDRALVTFFQGPASYTGEDVVEISCHGGWLTPSLVVQACVRTGAREAEAGEFTKRAYLHGKLDLVQAEAIADLVEARNRAMRDAAAAQLERGLSARVSTLRERVVRVEALLAHHVDFPEEDDPPVPLEEVVAEARALAGALERMLATAPEGALLREGALVVFAGAPNVGKSSLYNALLGEERAIVTPEAGTTRDALEVSVQMGGFPFRLVDTAGLRGEAEHVERLGIEVAEGYLQRADLVLLCAEAGDEAPGAVVQRLGEVSSAPVVLVETKADEVSGDVPEQTSTGVLGGHVGDGREGGGGRHGGHGGHGEGGRAVARVRLSAVTGEGLEALRTLLPELVYSSVISAGSEEPVVTRQRQARALGSALEEVRCFVESVEDGVPAEMAATHLREAATGLEELLGLVTVDDVLDVVFREFCIGK